MKVEDIVMVVDECQMLSIEVMMEDIVDGIHHPYNMTWVGVARDVPLSIMRTDVRHMNADCYYDGLQILSEM